MMAPSIPEYQIRAFQTRDAQQIAQLFHDTVHNINIRDYSSSQVQAWAPDQINVRDWATDCANYFTYVADLNGTIIGFGELAANGYIRCFYCHHQYQGCGVGRQIYQAIESQALQQQQSRLFTEASITAKPFFERMGFSVFQEQCVARSGEFFINYLMKKLL